MKVFKKLFLLVISLTILNILHAQSSMSKSQLEDLFDGSIESTFQKSNSNGISFMENKGQMHDQNYQSRPDVLFGAMAGNMTFHLKTSGVSYQLTRVDSYKEVEDPKTNQTRKEIDQQTIYRVDLSWLNANTNLRTTTDQTLEGYNNYYLESCPDGALNVKSYTGVTVHNMYNGINLHYYEKEGQLKHDYIVAPGANYQQIQLKVEGATVHINEDGSLTLTTPLGKIIEGAPIVFQNGKQLKAKWIIKTDGERSRTTSGEPCRTISFEIQNYNPNQELIIDPVTRLWGTYYGGNTNEYAWDSCTDATGNVYMSGPTQTSLGTTIATVGAHQVIYGGNVDAFLVKFNSAGVRQWGNYYGGTLADQAAGCCVDAFGNVFFTGFTKSIGTSIVTAGAHQTTYGGGTYDAFIVKFNANGIRQWGSYYGGSSIEIGLQCSTDASGNVYFVGMTASNAGISSIGSHQTTIAGGTDAFLVKFDAAGVRQWGTYYGGSSNDDGNDCYTDASGSVYLTGNTASNDGTTIANVGSHQPTYGGGGNDAYLVKFDATGVRQWGTYYGGAGDDKGSSCATDANGNVYLAGYSTSNTGTEIATIGAHQPAHGGGGDDAFLVKFNPAGARQWGTYYGGIGIDQGVSCATDASGRTYMTGYTDSNTGTVIATAGSYQATYGGGVSDAFLVTFNTNGSRQWGTYYGGADVDQGLSCFSELGNIIYMAGYTISNNGTTIATVGSHQNLHGGSEDAFLVKFLDCSEPTTGTDVQTGCDSYTWINGTTYTASNNSAQFTLTNAAGCDSVVTLNLIINSSTTATESQTACDSYTWSLNGTTYTSSGTFTHVGTNGSGCPLTTTLNLTINSSTTATENQTACDSYTWPLNGTMYASSGTYTHVGTNASGCTLTTTLNLTINNSTTASESQTSCDSYTWPLNGTTYTSSGTYTHVGTNASGCPLTTTLNLTINNSTTASESQTACDSYNWALNGTTYTSSGTYTHVGTNANGCPLTTTLNLTINNSTTASEDQTSCDSYTWALNGTTYTTSGTYTHIGTNAAGCSHTTTLNLTINNSTTASVNQTACDSYTWPLNGTTYTTSGTYTHVGTNAAGCTHTTALNLTINNTTTASESQTACDSYTWALNGTTYTSSGTYTHVGTNANGCLLTTTLNLTINNSTTASVSQTSCDSYTWPLNGTTYTSSGTYTHVGTNAAGCQLTTTLNLTINTVNSIASAAGNTITVNEAGASYQWVDCNNANSLINGANAQSFTPTSNGSYAVIVTKNGCSETSNCVVINTIGITEIENSSILVYPNPSNGEFVVDFGSLTGQKEVIISDGTGKIVFRINTEESLLSISLNLPKGMYQVMSISENYSIESIKKMIIN